MLLTHQEACQHFNVTMSHTGGLSRSQGHVNTIEDQSMSSREALASEKSRTGPLNAQTSPVINNPPQSEASISNKQSNHFEIYFMNL